ncbi:MAG: Na+/H+ antiporter subunit E [Candidatus Promineifilaceae bacterium]|nr:Na+/H+ antiporter subunit E [Candidatus Promineifilaceae bacterium]
MQRSFLLNIFLALVWTFLQGELQVSNFVVGFVVGYIVLALSQHILGQQAYVAKVGQVAAFVLFFLWDITWASIKLAWIIVQPRLTLRPAIVAVPLDARTSAEIAMLANLITLSPGTLSVDVSSDRETLYVHTILLEDPESLRREIKSGYERRVLEVMR